MARKSLTLTIVELPEGGFVICSGGGEDEFPLKAAETLQSAGLYARDKICEHFMEETSVNFREPIDMPTVLARSEPRRGGLLGMIRGGKR